MSSGTSYCDSPYMYGVMYANFSASFSETSGSVSIDNNTSKVSYSAYANYSHSEGYGFSGSTRSEAGYLRVYVNGSLVASNTCPMDSGMSPGYRLRTLSGTTGAITHNADGSKTVGCYVRIDSGNDPYGGGFVWSSASGGTDNVKLTTIARASTPSINTYPTSNNTFALDDTITIHMNRASSSFTHDVVFYYGNNNNRSTTVATGVTNNCTFNTSTISAQFLADNPNKSSLSGKIKVTTKNGSTNIGSKEITYTATIPNTYAPTVSNPDIHETALVSSGIADKVIVRYLSVKYVEIQAAAKNGASISSVVVKNGTASKNLTLSNDKWTGSISNLAANNITLTATDSRGKTASYTFDGISFVEYSYPTIINATLERTNASTGASELTVNGTYWNGTAGTVTNAITITYRLNTAQSPVSMTPSYSGSSWNSNALPGNLDPQSSFSAVINVNDAFNQTTTLTVQLPSAHNALWIGKKTVRAHDYLIADTDVWLNDGTVKLSDLTAAKTNISNLQTFTTTKIKTTYVSPWQRVKIGDILILYGSNKGGGTVKFGVTFAAIPMIIAGAPYNESGHGSYPNVQVSGLTTSSMWFDTNYGNNTKYTIPIIIIGRYTGNI